MKRSYLLTPLMLLSSIAIAAPQNSLEQMKEDVIKNYTNVVFSNYSDALTGAVKLDKEIAIFLEMTKNDLATAEQLETQYNIVKETWKLDARIPYGQSEIFRFYNGPIDFEAIDDNILTHLESIEFEGVEGQLNAWPLDENYIDYVSEDMEAGIVNNRNLVLDKSVLSQMNEAHGEKNISTGYHAIEFLLWGQDTSDQTAGQRKFTDYIDNSSAKNQDRRREVLRLVSDLLVEQLGTVHNQWVPETTNYRTEFSKLNSKEALEKIFTSLILMSADELKSERIENAFILEDQEEEHSCFSDQTINDIYTNAKGVMNVYYGEYANFNSTEMIKGVSISDLTKVVAPQLDNEMNLLFNALFTQIDFFYKKNETGSVQKFDIAIPFDRAITTNKLEVQNVIDLLDRIGTTLEAIAEELKLDMSNL